MFSMAFERTHGVHRFLTHADVPVTAVSQPDWEGFMGALQHLDRERAVGAFVVTPELMTVADLDFDEPADAYQTIVGREAEAAAWSAKHPGSTLLLGTVVFDPEVERPRNGVRFLRSGSEIGRTHKTAAVNPLERDMFHFSNLATDVGRPSRQVASLVCSDILGHPQIRPETDTALISACWNVPTGFSTTVADQQSLEDMLRFSVQELFARHPRLITVIMADRMPPDGTAAPFNFVAHRQTTLTLHRRE